MCVRENGKVKGEWKRMKDNKKKNEGKSELCSFGKKEVESEWEVCVAVGRKMGRRKENGKCMYG